MIAAIVSFFMRAKPAPARKLECPACGSPGPRWTMATGFMCRGCGARWRF